MVDETPVQLDQIEIWQHALEEGHSQIEEAANPRPQRNRPSCYGTGPRRPRSSARRTRSTRQHSCLAIPAAIDASSYRALRALRDQASELLKQAQAALAEHERARWVEMCERNISVAVEMQQQAQVALNEGNLEAARALASQAHEMHPALREEAERTMRAAVERADEKGGLVSKIVVVLLVAVLLGLIIGVGPQLWPDATESLVVATGIVNIWKSDAAELADSYHRIQAKHPGRLMLGIGSGHREATPERVRPIDAMSKYLDVLDQRGVPAEARVLSALGPRMLAMAAERSAGTHPYLTIPSQTREQRTTLGPGALIAPEQTVILDTDPDSGRLLARKFLDAYLGMVNYTSTMQRGGFTAEDVAGGGSDRLVDAIVVHGDPAVLAAAVRAHLDAGADHVCVQVQPAEGDVVPALRAIAAEMALPKPG